MVQIVEVHQSAKKSGEDPTIEQHLENALPNWMNQPFD